jgi:hypothetical protein
MRFKVGDIVCFKNDDDDEFTLIITEITKDSRKMNRYKYVSLLQHRQGTAYGKELSREIEPCHLEYVYSKVMYGPKVVFKMEEVNPSLKGEKVNAKDLVWALLMKRSDAFFKWLKENPLIRPRQGGFITKNTWLETFLFNMSYPAGEEDFDLMKKIVELGESFSLDFCKKRLIDWYQKDGINISRKGAKIAEEMYNYLVEVDSKRTKENQSLRFGYVIQEIC